MTRGAGSHKSPQYRESVNSYTRASSDIDEVFASRGMTFPSTSDSFPVNKKSIVAAVIHSSSSSSAGTKQSTKGEVITSHSPSFYGRRLREDISNMFRRPDTFTQQRSSSDQDIHMPASSGGSPARTCVESSSTTRKEVSTAAGVRGTFVSASVVAEPADDNSEFLPSADELTLSDEEDFVTLSPQSRSSSVTRGLHNRVDRHCRNSRSSSSYDGRNEKGRLFENSSSNSSCGAEGSNSQIQQSKQVSQSAERQPRLPLVASRHNSSSGQQRDHHNTTGWSAAACSYACCDRSWRSHEDIRVEAEGGVIFNSNNGGADEAAPSQQQAFFERLWGRRSSVSSLACACSAGNSACTHPSFFAERTFFPSAAAASSQESPYASIERLSSEGLARSSRSSTAQSSFSSVSNVSSTSTSGSSVAGGSKVISGGTGGGGHLSPKESLCSDTSVLSSSSPNNSSSSNFCGVIEGTSDDRAIEVGEDTRVCNKKQSGATAVVSESHGYIHGERDAALLLCGDEHKSNNAADASDSQRQRSSGSSILASSEQKELRSFSEENLASAFYSSHDPLDNREEESCSYYYEEGIDEDQQCLESLHELSATLPRDQQIFGIQQHSRCQRSAANISSSCYSIGGSESTSSSSRNGNSSGRYCNTSSGSSDPLRDRERREARERQTLQLARQIIARFRAIHGTSAAADAVQLLQRYFNASKRHQRDARTLEKVVAACCYISARQKGVYSTSCFCLNDLAAEIQQPLPRRCTGRGEKVSGSHGKMSLLSHSTHHAPQTLQLTSRDTHNSNSEELAESTQDPCRLQGNLTEVSQRQSGEMVSLQDSHSRQQGSSTIQKNSEDALYKTQQENTSGRSEAPERERSVSLSVAPLYTPSLSSDADNVSVTEGLTSVASHYAREIAADVSWPDKSSFLEPAVSVSDTDWGGGRSSEAVSAFRSETASYASSHPPVEGANNTSASITTTMRSLLAADTVIAAAPAALGEVSVQSDKSAYGGHARCRTVARWIARVCRRLQLQQLPQAEPDIHLRCDALLRRVRQLLEQRMEEEEEKSEQCLAALTYVQQGLQQRQQHSHRQGEQQHQRLLRGYQRPKNAVDADSPGAEQAGEDVDRKQCAVRGQQQFAGDHRRRKALKDLNGGRLQRDGDEERRIQSIDVGKSSTEEIDDIDLLLLRSVLAADEVGEILHTEKAQNRDVQHHLASLQQQTRPLEGPEGKDVAASASLFVSKTGRGGGTVEACTAAADNDMGRQRHQQAERQATDPLALEEYSKERDMSLVNRERWHSVLSPLEEQSRRKRSREAPPPRQRLSCLETPSEPPLDTSIGRNISGSENSVREERRYEYCRTTGSEDVSHCGSTKDDSSSSPAREAFAGMKNKACHETDIYRCKSISTGVLQKNNIEKDRQTAESSLTRRAGAPCSASSSSICSSSSSNSRANSWQRYAKSPQERRSGGQSHNITESRGSLKDAMGSNNDTSVYFGDVAALCRLPEEEEAVVSYISTYREGNLPQQCGNNVLKKVESQAVVSARSSTSACTYYSHERGARSELRGKSFDNLKESAAGTDAVESEIADTSGQATRQSTASALTGSAEYATADSSVQTTRHSGTSVVAGNEGESMSAFKQRSAVLHRGVSQSSPLPSLRDQISSSDALDELLERGLDAGSPVSPFDTTGSDDDSVLWSVLAAVGKSLDSSCGGTTATASAEEGQDFSEGDPDESRSHAGFFLNDRCVAKGIIYEEDGGTILDTAAAAVEEVSGGSSFTSPQYMQRVLQLHMKKSAWQRRSNLLALEKLKKDKDKVFKGLILMYRVLSAVYNRAASGGSRSTSQPTTSTPTSTSVSRTAGTAVTAPGAAPAGKGEAASHTDGSITWCTGRSEDPLDGVWRARGRSDAVCMASLIILVFHWVQVVVPQRVVIDALHVDRKSVYTRRMEHMRILRALFRRLKKQDRIFSRDNDEDLAALFCEILDSPALSRRLLEVAKEGLSSSEIIHIMRREVLSSLYVPALLPPQHAQGKDRQNEAPHEQEERQQQEDAGWLLEEFPGTSTTESLSQGMKKASSQLDAAEKSAESSSSYRAASQGHLVNAQDVAPVHTSVGFAAVTSHAAVTGEHREVVSAVDNSGAKISSKFSMMCPDTEEVRHMLDKEDVVSTKRARREFCHDERRSSSCGATAKTTTAMSAGRHEEETGIHGGKAVRGSIYRSYGLGNERAAVHRGEAAVAAAVSALSEVTEARLHHSHREEECCDSASASFPDHAWRSDTADNEAHARKSDCQLRAYSSPFSSPRHLRETHIQEEERNSLGTCAGFVGIKDSGVDVATYLPHSLNDGTTGDVALSDEATAEERETVAGDGEAHISKTHERARSMPPKTRRAKARGRSNHQQLALPSSEQLKLAKAAVLQSLPPAADVVSLQFERTQQRWVCKWLQSSSEGRAAGWKRRCFSVLKYGYDGAHLLAAAAATKLREGRHKLQQQQQLQGKLCSAKYKRTLPASAAASVSSPTFAKATTY